MSTSNPARVVIAGAGVAGLEAVLALRDYAEGRVQVSLLAPDTTFTYRPTSVGEPFGHARAQRFAMAAVLDGLGVDHVADRLKWVDHEARQVHTEGGGRLDYDALLLALGASSHAWTEHALTLQPDIIDEQLHGIVQDLENGWLRSLAFIAPAGASWPLPLYELALMSAGRAYESYADATVTLITPEENPLAVFGQAASDAVRELLSARGVHTVTSAHCAVHRSGTITLYPSGQELQAQRIVTMPELSGPAIPGIPHHGDHGFLRVDRHGAVTGLERVYAAGDTVDFPIKHGGLAAQQADAVAQSIAALAGAAITPKGVVPVLYGALWDGERTLYLRARVTGTHGSGSQASWEPLWERPGKINARRLSAHLDALRGLAGEPLPTRSSS
jgi:sulfide:quinone oxidoreductase